MKFQKSKKGTFWVLDVEFKQKNLLNKHHFQFHPATKGWWSKNEDDFANLRQEWDDLNSQMQKAAEALDTLDLPDSRAEDADVDIPVPSGLSYLPYQRAGIAYMAKKKFGGLVGDEMGLGKTVQGLGTANMIGAKTILIICPSSLKLNWFKEANKWLVGSAMMTMGVCYSNRKYPDTDVVIINYESLGKFWAELREREWDIIICDEAHYMKNTASQRTRQVIGGLVKIRGQEKKKRITPLRAKKHVWLTGTPILNRPAEIWTAAHFFAPDIFTNQFAFWKRYCDMKETAFGSKDVSGTGSPDAMLELQKLLRESFMIRRMKNQVLKDLPAKIRQVIEVPADTPELRAAIGHEADFRASQGSSIRDLRNSVEKAAKSDDTDGYHSAIKQLKEGISAGIAELAIIRKDTAIAKIPLMVKHILETLESADKIIVFAHHRDVLMAYKEALGDQAVMIMGGMKEADKQDSVERFQNDPSVKVFIGSLKAAGVGLTLTKASMVIFGELSYVPADLTQAEDRAHRMGVEHSVLCQHFVLEGSIDARMASKVVEKQEMIDKALDSDEIALKISDEDVLLEL